MMDEIHRPVRAARPARVPQVAPAAPVAPVAPVASRAAAEIAPDSAAVRPPPSSGTAPTDEPPEAFTESTRQVSWESIESLLKPAEPVHERGTSPPPPSARSPKELDAEVAEPQSARDELLAAFLADAPLDGSVPPQAATAPPPASADTAPAAPRGGGPKRAEKVTVKRDK